MAQLTVPPRRVAPDPARTAQRPPAPARRSAQRWTWSGETTVMAAGWASMAMCLVLFLAEGGLSRFATVGGALTAVGILAGLAATNALLLMLLLAARVPVIDRVLGQPRATALHSRLGDWVVYGLGVHAVFILLGYTVMDNVSPIAEFLYLWAASDFILAVAGMGLLLVVVVSSIVAARRRLPYEVWHGIHLTSYAAVGLSIPHMFSMSGLLAQGAWQRTYWIAILVVTGAALLGFRFLAPLVTSLRHQLRVVRVQPAGPDAYSIELSGRRLDQLGARSGQYLHWRFLGKGLWWHQHPFSLSAAPRADRLRITVRTLGAGSAALASVRPGTRVFVEGPYGTFTDTARTSETVALVGAGIGIAPIRALLEDATFAAGNATVVLRASRADELYLLDEIEWLCRRRGANLVVLTGHRADGRWVPAESPELTLDELVPDLADADLFVCGPSGFTERVVAEARQSGVPARRIHVEDFAW
ncbi:MAG: ferric reductase-like transmembrane domain-containing protein [Actinobacteria bacterium]|nr:ferric reductase-like transmembrane domain-containing protein [Actinomycetota bacterium]